jgi:flagellar biogenesis protein FliO
MSPEATYLLQSLGTVAVFGGALYGATAWLRRASAPKPGGPIEVLARQPLDGRRAIYLVRVGRRVLVVGAGESGGLHRLASLPAEAVGDLDSAPRVRAVRFGETLARVVGREPQGDPRAGDPPSADRAVVPSDP